MMKINLCDHEWTAPAQEDAGAARLRGPWAYKGATSRRAPEKGRGLSGFLRSTRRLKPLRPY